MWVFGIRRVCVVSMHVTAIAAKLGVRTLPTLQRQTLASAVPRTLCLIIWNRQVMMSSRLTEESAKSIDVSVPLIRRIL